LRPHRRCRRAAPARSRSIPSPISPAGDEQPALSQTGWQDAIASIEVKSGVWDFFTDENFSGNNMRLRPGTYQNLGPDWTRKINSFMCVMTAVPQ
jgi:hypothetical protein